MEVALRQDIGPDPSLEHNKVNWTVDQDHDMPQLKYHIKYKDNAPAITPDAYFSGLN